MDDDIQIIERNGFGSSRNDWRAHFSPPVEPNRSFQKEDTPFEGFFIFALFYSNVYYVLGALLMRAQSYHIITLYK